LDDVFWRSIVWAARKPFVANTIPPFVTLSFDDCCGRQDFRYLDICTQHGYRPLVALFIGNIREEHLPFLRKKAEGKEILLCTHAMDYYDLQYFDFGVGEYGEEALREHFDAEDAFYRRLGVLPAQTVRLHWGELGVRSLPYLKQRGRTFICLPTHAGETKADQMLTEPGEGYWPYDSTQCFYDVLPDDHDFYTFGAFDERHMLDFLTGATVWLQESPTNDLSKAAEQAAYQIRHGLSNGFYAELLTHEQKLGVLKREEWDQVLARVDQLTSHHEKIYADHDYIGRYLRSKDGTWLAGAGEADGNTRCVLRGKAEVPLRLSVFLDSGGEVEHRYLEVPAFEGQMKFDVGEWK
jgi:hypothetical protein